MKLATALQSGSSAPGPSSSALLFRVRRTAVTMQDSVDSSCPYCGEPVELCIDESGGRHQRYVEDCPVCCRPWQVDVVQNVAGEWDATLRTSDE